MLIIIYLILLFREKTFSLACALLDFVKFTAVDWSAVTILDYVLTQCRSLRIGLFFRLDVGCGLNFRPTQCKFYVNFQFKYSTLSVMDVYCVYRNIVLNLWLCLAECGRFFVRVRSEVRHPPFFISE